MICFYWVMGLSGLRGEKYSTQVYWARKVLIQRRILYLPLYSRGSSTLRTLKLGFPRVDSCKFHVLRVGLGSELAFSGSFLAKSTSQAFIHPLETFQNRTVTTSGGSGPTWELVALCVSTAGPCGDASGGVVVHCKPPTAP